MAESNEENKKVKGFALLIKSILSPLNENKKFQEKFRDTDIRVLLNATNLNYAALIIIDHGSVRVESIPNKPKENLKKKNANWNGFLEMDTQTFLAIAMSRISIPGMAKKWLTGKIKMRGLRKLLILLNVFKFLTSYDE